VDPQEKILTLSPAAWCDQAAAMLATTIRNSPCYTVRDLEVEIRAGGATLYSVTADDGELVGYVVLRVETYEGGSEGVIVAGAGKLMGARLYPQILPALERMFYGVRSVRVEACRPGALRLLQKAGYTMTHAIARRLVEPAAAPARDPDQVLEDLQHAGSEACNRPRHGDRAPDLRSRPGKLHGGGGGSSSSSSSQQTNNVDRRLVTDGGSVGVSADSSTVSVNVLDAGAIAAAFDFAKLSDQETGKTLNSVLGLARDVFTGGRAVLEQGGNQVDRAYASAKGEATQKNMLMVAALAVVAIVGVTVLKK
jgi:hypothetical protein